MSVGRRTQDFTTSPSKGQPPPLKATIITRALNGQSAYSVAVITLLLPYNG